MLTFVLDKGEQVFLFTDGFSDQHNPNREKLGTRRLQQILSLAALQPFSMQKNQILDEIERFQQTQDQRDDMTMVCVKL